MSKVKIVCKKCGKKLLSYDEPGFHRYGSPIKQCPKCYTRYADPRFHEVAIEGVPARLFSIKSYIVLVIFGGLLLWRGIYLFGMYDIKAPAETQWFMPSVIASIGGLVILGGIFEIIYIVSGKKKAKYERLFQESEKRLSDKSYAFTLQDLGYRVPDKYL